MTANHGTVESSTNNEMMIRPKPMTKASEHRRITKPIMEKKRRARINNSLNELKSLILDALNKDPSRHSKLEKADILEMTVRHLQKLQRQQIAATIVNDQTNLNKYRAGYTECANEVGRYMGQIDGFDQTLRQRILGHLNHCVNSLNQMSNNGGIIQFVGNPTTTIAAPSSKTIAFPGMPTNLHVQIPNIYGNQQQQQQPIADINNNRLPSLMSDVDLNQHFKQQQQTATTTPPPSSASSLSSQFAFNLHSPPSSSKPISLTTNDLSFYRNKINHHQFNLQQSTLRMQQLNSPGSISSYTSEQMISPLGSDDYQMIDDHLEMAVDCTVSKSRTNQSTNDENVWRPW